MKKEDYTFEYIATQLNSVLQENGLDSVKSVVGESFGGIIAQHFASMYPDKTESLVLLSSLAKTELPPEIEFKHNYLLPIIKTLGEHVSVCEFGRG
jgi:pimeloyl-ACP methyl ester carboxylesterase